MKLYISDLSIFVLLLFYLPLVIWLWRKIIKMPITTPKKIALSVLFFIVAYLIPLGDVTYNSIAMAKVCPTAGLHIYKTVEVDGYAGDLGGKDTLERFPYRFVETWSTSGKIAHYERQSDGSISYSKLPQPIAEYEVVRVPWHFDKKRRVETRNYMFQNRRTKEILAEYPIFNALAGWVDRWLVYRWFGYGGSVGCHGEEVDNFIQQVFIPK